MSRCSFLTSQREQTSKFSTLHTVGFVPAVIRKGKVVHCTVGVSLKSSVALQEEKNREEKPSTKIEWKILSVSAAFKFAREGDYFSLWDFQNSTRAHTQLHDLWMITRCNHFGRYLLISDLGNLGKEGALLCSFVLCLKGLHSCV